MAATGFDPYSDDELAFVAPIADPSELILADGFQFTAYPDGATEIRDHRGHVVERREYDRRGVHRLVYADRPNHRLHSEVRA